MKNYYAYRRAKLQPGLITTVPNKQLEANWVNRVSKYETTAIRTTLTIRKTFMTTKEASLTMPFGDYRKFQTA